MSEENKRLISVSVEDNSPCRLHLCYTRVFINHGKIEINDNGWVTPIYTGPIGIAKVKFSNIVYKLIQSGFWYKKATLDSPLTFQVSFEWQGDMRKIMKIWGINDNG